MRTGLTASLAFSFLLSTTSQALAAPPGPGVTSVHVLGLDSIDDADEQADALTAALRERLRTMPGYSLGEPNQPLSSLMAVLKCKGSVPDAQCQSSILAKLNSERMIWGSVQKNKDTVSVELHYTSKTGQPRITRGGFLSNIKDPKDVRLNDYVTKYIDALLGLDAQKTPGLALAKVKIVSGNFQCGVLVDGEQKGQLANGQLMLELTPGQHSFELMKPCAQTGASSNITLASENVVKLATVLDTGSGGGSGVGTGQPPKDGKSGGSGRTIGGIALLAGGAALGGLAVYGLTEWLAIQKTAEKVPCTAQNLNAEPCAGYDRDRRLMSTIAIPSAIVGTIAIGAGIYLLATGGSSEEKTARLRLSPFVGSTSGAVLSGAF